MPRGFLAALLLAALPGSLEAARRKETLIYSRFEVDPGEWRYFEFPSKVSEARLEVRFEVLSPKESPGVRVTVQKGAEFEKFREDQPHRDFRTTSYQRSGRLFTRLPETGDYVVIVDNRQEAKRRSRVDLEVSLTTGPDPETLPVTYASPHKRLIIIAASVAGFLLIVLLSGRALWRATRRRHSPQWS